MKKDLLSILILTLGTLLSASTLATQLIPVNWDNVIVCPMYAQSDLPPTFDEPDCHKTTADKIDPQNSALWAKTTVAVPPEMQNDKQPHSVYVAGKTSSKVYFNGHFLGQNGAPHVQKNSEVAGKIDAMFYVPASLIKPQDNEIILQLSSHHGFLTLGNPINFIGFGVYSDPTYYVHRQLGVSVIPLGALLLGAIYFLFASFSPRQRTNNILFLLMSVFAGLQLLTEISRALIAYSYPFHDLRLLLIVSFSAIFGVCLITFIVLKLALKKPIYWVAGGSAITLITIILVPGFDAKTASAIFVSSALVTALLAFRATKTKSKELVIYAAVFLTFSTTIMLTINRFHDVLFYYIIAGVLIFLFVQQALKLNREQRERAAEQQLVAKLQTKLEQNQQETEPKNIKISSAGKIDIIASNTIMFCKAAGDYAEINLQDNKQILFSGNLKELETTLPNTFLRVHRSYLVNMKYIRSLHSKSIIKHSEQTAGGFLQLDNDLEVPVSRRIIPTVREFIKQN